MMESAEEINRELQYFYGRLNNLGYDNNNYNMDKQIREATFAQQRKNRKGGKSKKKSIKSLENVIKLNIENVNINVSNNTI